MARMKKLYAPYTKVNGKWVRATWPASDRGLVPEHPMRAYKKETAIRVYQDWLLAGNGELRPVPVSSKEYDTNREWEEK